MSLNFIYVMLCDVLNVTFCVGNAHYVFIIDFCSILSLVQMNHYFLGLCVYVGKELSGNQSPLFSSRLLTNRLSMLYLLLDIISRLLDY